MCVYINTCKCIYNYLYRIYIVHVYIYTHILIIIIYIYIWFSFELGLSPRMEDPSYGKFKKDNDDEPADLGNRTSAIRQWVPLVHGCHHLGHCWKTFQSYYRRTCPRNPYADHIHRFFQIWVVTIYRRLDWNPDHPWDTQQCLYF